MLRNIIFFEAWSVCKYRRSQKDSCSSKICTIVSCCSFRVLAKALFYTNLASTSAWAGAKEPINFIETCFCLFSSINLALLGILGTPSYLYSMFSTDYSHRTRQAQQGMIKPSHSTKIPRKELTASSFRHRAVQEYNILPPIIREATTSSQLKLLAKKWIMLNIPTGWNILKPLPWWCLPPPSYLMGGCLHNNIVT